MKEIFQNDWQEFLESEMEKEYYQNLRELLIREYQEHTIYPDMYHIFSALHETSYKNTKVVILGQDPYHGPEQAHGMAFSVREGIGIPPSLQNIYKELESDLGIPRAGTGFLMPWAKEGVLLLNTTLTVRQSQPMSHSKIGWEIFTDKIISLLDEKEEPVVFLLWGAHARSKKKLLHNEKHLVLEAPHPSPLSAHRGFFGSKPFSKTNEFLEKNGVEGINWDLNHRE